MPSFSSAGQTRPRPAWVSRWPSLLQKIQRVASEQEQAQLLDRLAQPRLPQVLAFANAHALNCAARAADFHEALLQVDTLLRDGSGMATLFSLQGLAPGLNLNGTDLIPQLIHRFDGRPIALFGTQEPHLQRAAEQVQAQAQLAPGSSLVCAHGFHTIEAYVRLAQAQPSALIVLGMGMPRQEEVALALRAQLEQPCLIVCGGAILDFLGGKTARAPAWMRHSGTEWLYRLVREPRRLFRRYVLGNPLFVWRAVQLKHRASRGRL